MSTSYVHALLMAVFEIKKIIRIEAITEETKFSVWYQHFYMYFTVDGVVVFWILL
jgi:hypothetical protein